MVVSAFTVPIYLVMKETLYTTPTTCQPFGNEIISPYLITCYFLYHVTLAHITFRIK